MDLFLIILCFIFIAIAAIGCFLPALPGLPLAYIAILCLHFTESYHFQNSQLIIWLIVVIIIQIADFYIPMWGTKKFGGSKQGELGCLVGTIIGAIFFPPLGIIIGPFLGAFLAESLMEKKDFENALLSALGAFIGFMISSILKIAMCIYFLVIAIKTII